MGGTSKVIMGATLIIVVSLAMVLGLVLVLLAQLYCSLLCRRRQLRKTNNFNTTTSVTAATTNDNTADSWQQEDQSGAPSLSNFYAQGVLQAPRSYLFPAVSSMDDVDLEKQHSQQPQYFGSNIQQSTANSHHVRVEFSSPPSPTRFTPLASPKLVQEVPFHCSTSTYNDTVCSSSYREQFIYICNPIYDNEASRASGVDTPFETPDTSPSRLDTAGSSGEDDIDQLTPPLTPMKKLPAEACSVSLRDARSLATSGSDSNTNNDGISSSSSASPCTSPSW